MTWVGLRLEYNSPEKIFIIFLLKNSSTSYFCFVINSLIKRLFCGGTVLFENLMQFTVAKYINVL